MSTSPKVSLGEDGIPNERNTFAKDANESNEGEQHLEHEEEEEEEDIDFNPFLRDSPSIEASSSLSSELDAWGCDVADSKGEPATGKTTDLSSLLSGQVQDCTLGDSEQGEGIVVQTTISSGQIGEKESAYKSSTRSLKRKAGQEPETEKDGEERVSSNTIANNDVMDGDVANPGKAFIFGENEDAICKRTRARYSLASFTLDELETFLQETDDDDDIQNVDDEEEYRKFLAAVLLDGVNDDQIIPGVENVDDEDEDNDADFEIEIEEALESDPDENIKGNSIVDDELGNRRPETRLNKRQQVSSQPKNNISSQINRPLRPLLPNAPKASFPVSVPVPETASVPFSFSGHVGLGNGFAQHQLGQLHCIIHEHVQLLIQVFSLCIVDPSKQHIASQVQGLISELLHQRDQSISWKLGPYPYGGSSSQSTHPSVQNRINEQGDCISAANKRMLPDPTSSLENSELASNGRDRCPQASNRASGVSSGSGSILSVLDVAPLKLAGKYMEDISIALREYQRQCLQASCDTSSKKEPLFPFHISPEVNAAVSKGTLVGDQPQKKTLAATIVEKSKNQSVALVPKEIAGLAQRFFPMFNPALFPHKPPPPPVANRILFTDAEDELLALGLMEYNNDWKAIQQRFLPCKSKHQIFVRQKNRSSSKAPDNPIKAVRRMKTSPLTAEEIRRIQEGLKVFKLDWMSIWKCIVPYRDPTLLPRQWRIASGTQKSYKGSEDKKEKRRLYALQKRKCISSAQPSCQTVPEREECHTDTVGENNSGDDCVDSEDGAYVHQAFLADWRPGHSMVQGGSRVMGRANSSASLVPQQRTNYELPVALYHSQNLGTSSQSTGRNPVYDQALTGSNYQLNSRSRRSRRGKNTQFVKLAPDLPPVTLPSSVRVISQSAFKRYQRPTHTRPDGAVGGFTKEPTVSSVPPVANNSVDKSGSNQRHQESSLGRDKSFTGDKDDSDLQMHPLLFQSSGDGHLPYYQLNGSNSASSSLNFLPQIEPQLNLSLLHNPRMTSQPLHWFQKSSQTTTSSPGGIDFHPLLQKSGEVNCDSVIGLPASHLAVNSNSASDKTIQSESQPDNCLSAPHSNSVCPNEKANELDLDIHLSFTRSKDTLGRGKASLNLNDLGSMATLRKSPYFQGDSVPPDRSDNQFNLGSCAPVVSTSNIITPCVGNGDDCSLPEIVMEQEELSDSEEEFGEDVQFECEEMDDSEADEGSDSELQIMDKQNKDVPSAVRSQAMSNADIEVEQAQTRGHLQFGAGQAAECGASRLSLASEEKEKENSINISLLHNRLEETGRKHAVTGSSVGMSNNSCKKLPTRRKRVGPKQQENGPEPGSGTAKRSRRTRKSVGESSLSVKTGRTRKRNSSVNTGTAVENTNNSSNCGVS